VKRIAAMAALIVAMLAVPAAAAMASTSTPGSAHAGQYLFCQPKPFQHRHHGHHGHHGHHARHGHHRFNLCNFPSFPAPAPSVCNGASFTFSWVSNTDNLYEISGPTLSAGEQFSYNGSVYTIVFANPAAGNMQINTTNYGPPIVWGTGYLC
jgi:hypothetical protein